MRQIEFIYTPKYGSWLNMTEIELNVLNGQCLSKHIDTMEKIKLKVAAWQTNRKIRIKK